MFYIYNGYLSRPKGGPLFLWARPTSGNDPLSPSGSGGLGGISDAQTRGNYLLNTARNLLIGNVIIHHVHTRGRVVDLARSLLNAICPEPEGKNLE